MPLTYAMALIYSVVPAAAGYVAALVLMAPVRQASKANPMLKGKGIVLMVVPLTSVIFANVAAVLASRPTAKDGLQLVLVGLGGAGAVTALLQGFVARTGFGRVGTEPTDPAFGKLLVRTVVPEVVVLVAFVAFVLAWTPANV